MVLIVKYINIMWLEKTTYHPTLWTADPWFIVPNKLNIPVRQILAHNGPPIMTGSIVPSSIYHRHAGLLSQSSCGSEPIRLGNSFATGHSP